MFPGVQIRGHDIAQPPQMLAVEGRLELFFLVLKLSGRAAVKVREGLSERLRFLARALEKIALGIEAVQKRAE